MTFAVINHKGVGGNLTANGVFLAEASDPEIAVSKVTGVQTPLTQVSLTSGCWRFLKNSGEILDVIVVKIQKIEGPEGRFQHSYL